jgi:hypothetical protein
MGSPAAVGLDLDSSRVRAMAGEPGRPARPLLLDEPHADLPMAVFLEKRLPEPGRPALGNARRTPHLACFDFLASLGTPHLWQAGRHRFDAAGLLLLILDRIRTATPRPEHLASVLPIYLAPSKVNALNAAMERAKLTVRGSAVLPLALLAACDLMDRRPTLTLVIDVDNHALTGTVVVCEAQHARVLAQTIQPRLNERVWKERLLDALSDRCVRACRRDPRDSAAAEQALYDQLDDAMDRAYHGQRSEIAVRSESWFQNLIHMPDDFDTYCAPLVRQAMAALREPMTTASPVPPQAVWLTMAAGRLPGLVPALRDQLGDRTTVSVLSADAGTKAAVALAGRWFRDELPRMHLDTSIPLPEGDLDRPRDSAPLLQRFRAER